MSYAKYKEIDELQTAMSAAGVAAVANDDVVDRFNDLITALDAALTAKSATGTTLVQRIGSLRAPA